MLKADFEDMIGINRTQYNSFQPRKFPQSIDLANQKSKEPQNQADFYKSHFHPLLLSMKLVIAFG